MRAQTYGGMAVGVEWSIDDDDYYFASLGNNKRSSGA